MRILSLVAVEVDCSPHKVDNFLVSLVGSPTLFDKGHGNFLVGNKLVTCMVFLNNNRLNFEFYKYNSKDTTFHYYLNCY
jgi:hypothetical protein